MANRDVNKIGYCDNADLGINYPGGHYVFIRSIKNGMCSVNTITSIERNNRYNFSKLDRCRNGKIYPIPINDATFTRYSGIDDRVINNIPLSSIKDINHKKIKRRHLFFIKKFMG